MTIKLEGFFFFNAIANGAIIYYRTLAKEGPRTMHLTLGQDADVRGISIRLTFPLSIGHTVLERRVVVFFFRFGHY